MRKRQRGPRPVSDEPLSAGRVEYLEQARERVRNRRIRRTALIVVALTLVVLFTTGIVGSSVAMAKDWADTARILLFPGTGWPQQTGVMEVKQLAAMNSSFVELGEEGCVVWSRTGTRLNSIQSGYARPALAVGKNRFVLYNRSGNELRVESRTQNLYTKTMESSITLCAMADNGTLAVVTEDPGSAARLRVYSSSMEQLLSWSLTITDGTPLRLAFSPDGRRLAVAAVTVNGGQMVTNFYVVTLAQGDPLLVGSGSGAAQWLSWTGSQSILAVCDSRAVLYNASGGERAAYDFTGQTLRDISVDASGNTALLLASGQLCQAVMLGRDLGVENTTQVQASNRIVRAAEGRPVSEFGSRRAQGTDGAISGARAAYIGGCAGTACTISDQLYGVPAGGTMAHSWVQMFDSQYEAFKTYCQIYPHNATLLVDTYNVLKSGVPDAIRAFDEVLKPLGIRKCGIRLDSGDMAYLTQEARRKLDAAGWTECQISASNSLDEYIIQDLLLQGAKIDVFGVGERMITARSEPVFGGVYKLAAVEDGDGKIIPKIKVSENLDKITIPHFKKTYRIFDNATGKAEADYITVWDETVDESAPLELFDPRATWKRKTYTNFTAKPLQVPVFQGGELVYQLPALPEIQAYCRAQVDTLWDTVKRFENPHTYYVDLSQKLFDIKQDLLCRSR